MLLFKKSRSVLLALLLASLFPVHTQSQTPESGGVQAGAHDPAAFVGISLNELIRSFGIPRLVYVARGAELWQDDVVFVYEQGDFYIYRDRVWQVGISAVRGIKIGDPHGVISLIMGPNAVAHGDSFFYPLHGNPWPLMLRWDIDSAGNVQGIFIFRSDL
ncbi:MAG: hypothetical protein FWD91_03905 [Treponema sp.]|nr:hypothetical protein [Treponema sp.]